MARLPRPNPPLDVRLRVVLRQIGTFPEVVDILIEGATKGRRLGKEVEANLFVLACTLGCPMDALQLDHDEALENREKLVELANGRRKRTVVVPDDGAAVLRYYPDANDPAHLFYRPHGAEFVGSHKVKMVRGDHGQHSDLAMARKNKNIAMNRDPKRRKAKIPNRKRAWPKRKFRS